MVSSAVSSRALAGLPGGACQRRRLTVPRLIDANARFTFRGPVVERLGAGQGQWVAGFPVDLAEEGAELTDVGAVANDLLGNVAQTDARLIL